MRVDRFDVELGAVADGEPNEKTTAHKRENFEMFLRAGGCFTWNDWLAMSDDSCMAAVAAGDAVKLDYMRAQAQLFVEALRAPSARAPSTNDVRDAARASRVRGCISKSLDEACARQSTADDGRLRQPAEA